MENISQLLTDIKAKSRLSEAALAYRLGVSQPTVNRILNGQSVCKSTTLMRIIELKVEFSVDA